MSEETVNRVVVVGGGQAGAQVVISLRQWGFEGDVTVLAEEPVLPYQRPPLSKAYMKGDFPEARLFMKQADWYRDNDIDVRVNTRAEAIDRNARQVIVAGADPVPYDALVLATGSRPRRLDVPGVDLDGVFDLRSLADADRVRPRMVAGKRIVIVGAGYIGLEAAAVARQMGLDVTVLERAPRVLERVTSPMMSEFYEQVHRSEGVDIRTSAHLDRFIGEDGRVVAAQLADGTELPADLVLVGIGIVPNDRLALEAGLACDDGIVVDRDTRTDDPRIFAAGDCTRRPLVHYGRNARLESVHNAIEQGRLAAAAILQRERPPEEAPWFWSDQYDVKLQIAGLAEGFDEQVVRGDPQARKFAVFYLKEGRLIAVDAIKSPAEFLASKKLIAAGARVDTALLVDETVPMKEIAAAAR